MTGAGRCRRIAALAGWWLVAVQQVGAAVEVSYGEPAAIEPPPPATVVDTARLPDGEVARGRDGTHAWLVGATDRYRHGVLGDAVEATGLRVQRPDGQRLTLQLPDDSVFEDRYPRFADLDRDGREELYLVRSYLDRGAALVVVRVTPEELRIVAETSPIGLPNRWLNPVGAADFTGAGWTGVAVVITPHIGGTLALYRLRDGRLEEQARAEGFSNHVIGSRELGMSALLDIDGNGAVELLVPGADRRELRVMSAAGGKLRELHRIAHDSPITGALAIRPGAPPAVVYRLRDGRGVTLRFR